MQFLRKMLTRAYYEAFVTMAERNGCHGNISVPVAYRDTGAKGSERVMQDGGVIPTTGFPRDGGTAKEGHRKDDSITVQNSSISFNTCIRSTAVVLGGIPSKRAIGAERVRSGVEEVGIHGTSGK